jgi:A/G-specific adenine glycosylase
MPEKNLLPVRKKLLRWYDDHKRDLPWRRSNDPYAIWLAETMLQQTRVKTALPYYEKFLKTFPTIEALARAPLPRLLRLWSGLGYYRRAENLKKAAMQIVRDHGGRLPDDYNKLRGLSGIGDYTAGAILSIAFDKRYPAIDGNVRRVFARLFSITDERQLRATVTRLASKKRPGDFNQALMELGATICTPKNPRCGACPVAIDCASRLCSPAKVIEVRRARSKFHNVTWPLAIVRRHGKILLRRRAKDGLLAGLWELPGLELARGEKLEHFKVRLQNELPFPLMRSHRIGAIRHSITHRRIHAPIYVFDDDSKDSQALARGRWRWLTPAEVRNQAISSMTAKAIRIFAEYEESLS